ITAGAPLRLQERAPGARLQLERTGLGALQLLPGGGARPVRVRRRGARAGGEDRAAPGGRPRADLCAARMLGRRRRGPLATQRNLRLLERARPLDAGPPRLGPDVRRPGTPLTEYPGLS